MAFVGICLQTRITAERVGKNVAQESCVWPEFARHKSPFVALHVTENIGNLAVMAGFLSVRFWPKTDLLSASGVTDGVTMTLDEAHFAPQGGAGWDPSRLPG